MPVPSEWPTASIANHNMVSIASIQRRVAEVFKTTRAELLSRRRTASVTRARHVAMYLCRGVAGHSGRRGTRTTWASFPRIGLAFERDHSSVIHACKKVALRRTRDTEFAQLIDDLERELGCGELAESRPAAGLQAE